MTRDKNVVTYMGPTAAAGRDFAVLYPDELPAFIDRRADATSYLPVQLEETEFTSAAATPRLGTRRISPIS